MKPDTTPDAGGERLTRRRGGGPRQLRAHARADGRPVLHRCREGAPGHSRGPPRHRDAARGDGRRRVDGDTGTFLRGIQRTDPRGLATFLTIFPGWYQGRTTHIHVKVHLGGNVVHTGQLYFPEATVTAATKVVPYSRRGAPDTRNAEDAIYRNGGSKSLTRGSRDASGRTVASITMGVHRA